MTIPNNPWRELGQIQRWMQAVSHASGGCRGRHCIRRGSAQHRHRARRGGNRRDSLTGELTALDRLAIYSYAYYARLLECMREEFPVLKHALGEEVFDASCCRLFATIPIRGVTHCSSSPRTSPATSLKPAPTGSRPRACRRTGRTS